MQKGFRIKEMNDGGALEAHQALFDLCYIFVMVCVTS